jgi:hypothetical protein
LGVLLEKVVREVRRVMRRVRRIRRRVNRIRESRINSSRNRYRCR